MKLLHFLFAWVALMIRSTFGTTKVVPFEGDYFTGDALGQRGFDISPINLGEIIEMEHIREPLSDLDGDPLNDDNYFESDIDDDDLYGDIDDEGEGAIFKKAKARRTARRAAKGKGPKIRLRRGKKAANLPAPVVNNAMNESIENQKAMDATPGSRLSKNQLLPFLSVNGSVDAAPTTVPIEGQNVFAAITRYQTTYPMLSQQKTTVSTGATITFTWADSDFAGGVGATPVIILSHSASALNAASGAKYTVTVSGYDETGRAISISAWAYRRKLANDRVLVYLIPYLEVASKLYPVIIKIIATKSLTVAVTGVPVDETLTCIMPGTNHADYLAFKDLIQIK